MSVCTWDNANAWLKNSPGSIKNSVNTFVMDVAHYKKSFLRFALLLQLLDI